VYNIPLLYLFASLLYVSLALQVCVRNLTRDAVPTTHRDRQCNKIYSQRMAIDVVTDFLTKQILIEKKVVSFQLFFGNHSPSFWIGDLPIPQSWAVSLPLWMWPPHLPAYLRSDLHVNDAKK
jgi:hypothetical protein